MKAIILEGTREDVESVLECLGHKVASEVFNMNLPNQEVRVSGNGMKKSRGVAKRLLDWRNKPRKVNGRPKNSHKKWKRGQDKLLKENYGVKSTKWLKRRLGRSKMSVLSRARVLGLRVKP